MNWDVLVFAANTPMTTHKDGTAAIPDDWTPPSLGALPDIHAQISAALPGADWSAPRWGRWEDDDASLEFNLGTDADVTSLMIHARGYSSPAISRLGEVTGWAILDTTTGTWLARATDPDQGQKRLQAELDLILAKLSPPKPRSLWDRVLGKRR